MTKEEKSTQKILNKIMSEELLANMFYTGCIVAADKDEAELFEKLFVEIAEDELDDHFMTLKQLALLNGFTVPYKVKEYSKFAEKDTKRLDSLKNEQKASYYIKQAIESEQDAIASYEEALKNEDLPYELHAILMKNMFEETEHLKKLTLLQNAFDSKYCQLIGSEI